jgi:exosome complex component RRP41
MGNTKVLCTVTGPAEGRNSGQRGGKDAEAKVEVEIGFAGFSGVERRRRKLDKYVYSCDDRGWQRVG